LKLGERSRRVLLQASKNGFFYVLDARTGAVISAKNFVPVNWTLGIDPETGKPIPNPAARYDETGKPTLVEPGGQGAHAWHPLSFDPLTGLAYFSGIETRGTMMSASRYKFVPMGANTGLEFPTGGGASRARPAPSASHLIAWDPVAQRAVWQSGPLGRIGAGTLSTAGGLVFQGTTTGQLIAYRATDGKQLWSTDAQTGVVAAPVSFEVGGEQYIAEEVGYGLVRFGMSNQSRLLVFKLAGTASLPPAPPPPPPPVLDPPASTAPKATIAFGREQFASHCAMCHDAQYANRQMFPDLRYSPALASTEAFNAIVLGGALQAGGMASFKATMSEQQVQAVRAYMIERANDLKEHPEPPR
jgi:quinohemoprotein ethanol dehydrogenase